MMRNQRGVTMIGWILLLIPVAIVFYAGLRAGPVYFDYYKVVTAMKETASKLKSDDTINAQTIKFALDKRFDTGYIDDPKIEDIKIEKVDKGWSMTADYERTIKLFGNFHVTMVFNKTVLIGKDAAAGGGG
jgi:hypothetical protein